MPIALLPFRTASLFLALLFTAGSVIHSVGSEQTNSARYRIVINGQPHVLNGRQTQQVTLEDGRKIQVAVDIDSRQLYRIPKLQFEYDAEMSLKDDEDDEARTVTLLHANGCGIVITDQGPAGDCNLKEVLNSVIENMLKDAKPKVVKDAKASIARVSLAHTSGLKATSSFVDGDGDAHVYYYYVVKGENRAASIIGFHDEDGKSAYSRMEKVTLDSLQETVNSTNKLDTAVAPK